MTLTLAALAELFKYSMKPGLQTNRQAKHLDQVIAAFGAEEQEAAAEEAKKQKQSKKQLVLTNLIVAFTACTTGIAHIYMAEEALIKKGKKWVLQSALKPTGHLVSATA